MSYNIDTLISVAENEVGYCEKASNSNLYSKTGNAGSGNYTKYWAELCPSLQGSYWCQAFVCWAFKTAFGKDAALNLLCCKAFGYYTPTMAGYFKSSGQWYTSNPKRGDVVYYKNDSRICHVGIVYKVDSAYIYTVEGNTSGASGVVANGGGVAMKKYSKSYSRIAGYGRPNYGEQTTTTTAAASTTTAASSGVIKTGVKCQVTASQLNIRSGAGSNYKVVGVLNKGHQLTVRGLSGSWAKVCVYPDNTTSRTAVTGWVYIDYLKVVS